MIDGVGGLFGYQVIGYQFVVGDGNEVFYIVMLGMVEQDDVVVDVVFVGIVIVGYQWVDVGVGVEDLGVVYDWCQFFFFVEQGIDFCCCYLVVVNFVIRNMY